MKKYFIFLIILTTLLTGSAISVLAQKNVKSLQRTKKGTHQFPNIKQKADLFTFEAESAKLISDDYNNDLTTSDTPGDVWRCSFVGNNVSIIAPKEAGAGKIEIKIDGKSYATADLSIIGTRKAQQVVCKVTNLNQGRHTVNVVNRGPGLVAIDAIIVQ